MPKCTKRKFDYNAIDDKEFSSEQPPKVINLDNTEILDLPEIGEDDSWLVNEDEVFSDEEQNPGDENKFYEKMPNGNIS